MSGTLIVTELLAQQIRKFPELGNLNWTISGGVAVTFTEPGQTLITGPGHDLITKLHAAGWERSATPGQGCWNISARLYDGVALLVRAIAFVRPDGTTWHDANVTVPYFAPPAPPIGPSEAAQAKAAEWLDRCARDDWDGWDPRTPGSPATADPDRQAPR